MGFNYIDQTSIGLRVRKHFSQGPGSHFRQPLLRALLLARQKLPVAMSLEPLLGCLGVLK